MKTIGFTYCRDIEALVEWLNEQDELGMDVNNTYFRIISENQVYVF